MCLDLKMFVLENKTEILKKRLIFVQFMQLEMPQLYEFKTFYSDSRLLFVEGWLFKTHRNPVSHNVTCAELYWNYWGCICPTAAEHKG